MHIDSGNVIMLKAQDEDVFWDAGRAKEKSLTEADVDPDELKLGIEIEKEHTTSEEMAKRIALDHLAETGGAKSKYYTYLVEMERHTCSTFFILESGFLPLFLWMPLWKQL